VAHENSLRCSAEAITTSDDDDHRDHDLDSGRGSGRDHAGDGPGHDPGNDHDHGRDTDPGRDRGRGGDPDHGPDRNDSRGLAILGLAPRLIPRPIRLQVIP